LCSVNPFYVRKIRFKRETFFRKHCDKKILIYDILYDPYTKGTVEELSHIESNWKIHHIHFICAEPKCTMDRCSETDRW
ncbi:MAG: hypothetical protein AABY22_36330, partial [Nanoarchaeota archaeon]